ncbi:MAG: nucleotidyltransferase domain-containing protein [Pseudomonas sp.]
MANQPFIVSDALKTEISTAIVKHCPADLPIRYAFLSGSIVEGLATPKSDFDIYLVSDSETLHKQQELFVATSLGLLEITLVDLKTLSGITENVQQGFHAHPDLSIYQLILAHRFSSGVPLLNDTVFLAAQQAFTGKHLANYLLHSSQKFSQKCFADAIGNLLAEDEDSAMFNADRAVHAALDTLLALNGSTSPLIKWRTRYAKRFLGETNPVLHRYMELAASLHAGNKAGKVQYISQAGRFIQALIDHATAHALDVGHLAPLQESRVYGPEEFTEKRDRACKSPFARLVEFKGAYVLCATSPLFELSQESLLVWLAIDNDKTQEEIVEALRPTPIDPMVVQSHLTHLQASGAVYFR